MSKSSLSLTYGQAFVAPDLHRHRSSMSVQIPPPEQMLSKGGCALISDSTWRNSIAKQAGDLSVRGFLADYYSTPEHWDIKTSATRVLRALNSWSHSQSGYIEGGSYICSLSAMIFHQHQAHLFHMGDTLVFRIRGAEFEQLTRDHVTDLGGYRYPSRALGLDGHVDIDYSSFSLKQGDLFLFMTQAVRGTLVPSEYLQLIRADVSDLDAACERLTEAANQRASERGYNANQFCFQLVRVDRLPEVESDHPPRRFHHLPVPPELEAGERIDGLDVIEVLSRTPRARIYRVRDPRRSGDMVMKAPSPELSPRNVYLEHFALQQWVVERINSPFVVKVVESARPRRHLYYLMAHVEGETLTEWLGRHPQASLKQRLEIARQLVKAVQALHRHEVLHQIIHPDNVMIDRHGNLQLIDFGACHKRESDGQSEAKELARQVGLNEHSAPEYALDTDVGRRSDQYSLASTIYWMLTGHLPYTTLPNHLRSHTDLERMTYRRAQLSNPEISQDLDDALHRSLDPLRALRFRRTSEFAYHLRPAPKREVESGRPPWREPANVWQAIATVLLLLLVLSWWLK
ncbi:bifunctional protein-serine/threonine kinase/phosphatase [Salinicola aestuarinus]|uniref:bifunctional protein-serine/threonine kinase/phosphatase n=1 Tax=Salinicola aestuarinus TaxID=1949082 RepID=UPI000DA1ABEA|nr:bifunctional protein-serine/threonine kinase/phosphatase [Salinicola aestuarinus]